MGMSFFEDIIHSNIGWFHFLTAILSMIAGTVVLFMKKGTMTHKRIGYTYVVAMLLMNISSFFIVNFGGFSLFHFFAIVSLISVFGGMLPTIKKGNNWMAYHFYFMNWSVVGLYCAFWAELGTRFINNMRDFWWVVALATLVTTAIGNTIINRKAKKLKFR